MKAKPVLILFGIMVVITSVALFFRGRFLSKPEKNEVYTFLQDFNTCVKQGNADNVLSYFDVSKKGNILASLVNVLTNKADLKGSKTLFSIELNVEPENIHIVNDEIASATLPVKFTSDSVEAKTTVLKLKIRKISKQTYKIVQVDANKLAADYVAYNALVKSKILTDKDIYDPRTLAAIETAEKLKAKYDSVVWYAHDGSKTNFYVVKGKWGEDFDYYRRKGDTASKGFKMGLLGPDLKEILPVEFDLIHNISGTFPGLIEVERGERSGFYDLQGKMVLPVIYNQIFPIDDDVNLAVLRKEDDYFYLKKDMTVSDKADLKVSDFVGKIKKIGGAFNLAANPSPIITEYNSREQHGTVYITPSYLVDLGLASKIETFKNPLRRSVFEEVHKDYNIGGRDEVKDDSNWLTASIYSIRDYFVGGRSEFYDSKNILIVDKKKNRIFSQNIGVDYTREEDGGEALEGPCNVTSIKVITYSLYEVSSGATLFFDLHDSTKTITGGPYYHYMVVQDNKLSDFPDDRFFGFTKYVKMNDSYLNACYNMLIGSGTFKDRKKQTIDRITPEMLRYMKNEIYADFGYQFKDKRWLLVFQDMPKYSLDKDGNPKPGLENVNDSLTTIDKYNINWITQKLKGAPSTTLAAK